MSFPARADCRAYSRSTTRNLAHSRRLRSWLGNGRCASASAPLKRTSARQRTVGGRRSKAEDAAYESRSTIARLQGGHNLLTVAVIFFVACALTTSIGFPALPFTVAGGAIFGHLLGATLSWGAALIGTMLGYALARFVGRETARRWLAKRAVGAALTQSTGFLTLLRLRLVPVIPLSVVNVAAGLA